VQVMRISGGSAIAALAHPEKSLHVEHYAALTATVLFFIGVVTYGATCYHSVQSASGFTTSVTSFAFLLTCFFLLCLQLLLVACIRSMPREAYMGWQVSGAQGSAERFADGFEEQQSMEEEEARSRAASRRQSRAYSSAASAQAIAPVVSSSLGGGGAYSDTVPAGYQNQA